MSPDFLSHAWILMCLPPSDFSMNAGYKRSHHHGNVSCPSMVTSKYHFLSLSTASRLRCDHPRAMESGYFHVNWNTIPGLYNWKSYLRTLVIEREEWGYLSDPRSA